MTTIEQPATPKHASLRAAINAAAAAMQGLVDKAGMNEQYHYAYVGHSHVVDHVRETLLEHGVAVFATDLRFVQALESRNGTLYLWEQTFRVEHEHSADDLVSKVQITTLPGEQSAAKASTAADRTFLMRLCRLAGRSEQDDAPRQQRGRAPARRGEVDEHGEVKPDPQEQEAATTEALTHLAKADPTEAKLVHWVRAALGNLDRVRATDEQRSRVWAAFDKRCKSAQLDAVKLAERARAPSSNRRNPKE